MFRNNGTVFTIMFLILLAVQLASLNHAAVGSMRSPEEAGAVNPRSGGMHSKEIVFALDMTGSTTKNGLNEVISRTAKQLLSHRVPPGVSIGIVQYGNKNMVIQNMTILENKHQREKITSKIKPESAAGDSSPFKGLAMATLMISNERGSILILSDEPWNNHAITKRDEMKVLEIIAMHHEVFNIVFSTDKNSDYEFRVQFLKYSNKTLIVNYEWMVSNPANILDAIIAIDSVNWEMNTKYISVTIDSQELSLKQNDWDCQFNVESSCKGNCTLEISLQSEFQQEYCSLQLIFPDGTVDNMYFDEELDTYWQSYHNPLTGIWNIALSCTNNQKGEMLAFKVTETYDVQEYHFSNISNILLNCIACDEVGQDGSILCFKGDNGNVEKPLVILAELRMNSSPLEKIEVIVSVKELSNSTKYIKEIFMLHDGGWGADKTDSDGIYSGYFNPFRNSSIQCGDQNENCIFMFECTAKGTIPGYGKFQRQSIGNIFQIRNQQKSYLPSPVRDLKVSLMNCSFTEYPRGYDITWTSTRDLHSKETDLMYKFHLETDLDSVMIDGKHHKIDIDGVKSETSIYPIIRSTKTFGETEFHSICVPEKKNRNNLCISIQSIVNDVQTVSNHICMPLIHKIRAEIPYTCDNNQYFWPFVIALASFLLTLFILLCVCIKLSCSKSRGNYVIQKKETAIEIKEWKDTERECLK